jgi:pimeloyl-ACP methyl ester carboxylesterase
MDDVRSEVQRAPLRTRTVSANNNEFGLLETGEPGPLALLLHGFPDAAHTWRHLLPVLAEAGFHAVAPFMRGYAPSAVPDDGCFSVGALIADAVALHEVLGGDERSVIVGHDWGADAAYGAVAFDPRRWSRLVTLAVPPIAFDPVLYGDYEQLKRFFYIFFIRDSPTAAEDILAADGMTFIDRLWQDWSPGYDAAEHLVQVKQSLRQPVNLRAAMSYYRAEKAVAMSPDSSPYGPQERAARQQAARPTLYLHGRLDGCVRSDLVEGAADLLAPGSQLVMVEDAGHFLHLEKPAEVNQQIVSWLIS